jgi:type IV pilus assembly protein PilM
VFQETNRSLVGYREDHAGLHRSAVFLHTDWEEREELLEALRCVFERDIVLLDPHLDRLGGPLAGRLSWGSAILVAAIGAAERMMR